MKGRWKRKHKEWKEAERVVCVWGGGRRVHRRQRVMEKERRVEPFGSGV